MTRWGLRRRLRGLMGREGARDRAGPETGEAGMVAVFERGSLAQRLQAVAALAKMPLADAQEPLGIALRDPSPQVSDAAFAALRQLGVAEPSALLQEILRDSQHRFHAPAKAAAARNLSRLLTRDAVDHLLAAALDPKPDDVSLLAIGALGDLGDPRARDVLRRIFVDRQRTTLARMLAFEALLQLGADRSELEALVAEDPDLALRAGVAQAGPRN